MMNDYQPIEALVSEIKATTGFVSILLSRKSGFVFLLIGLGVMISKFLLG